MQWQANEKKLYIMRIEFWKKSSNGKSNSKNNSNNVDSNYDDGIIIIRYETLILELIHH